MLGVSGNSGDGTAAATDKSGGGGDGEVGVVGTSSVGLSEEERLRFEESDRSSGGGNRWPRQETLALLQIRSDMDAAFRDSSLKGPLWDEVSRKLAEHGYHRSAKKCREKFENVYKYHKRTKEGRASKSDGKTYRFFDQLKALESPPSASLLPPPGAQTVLTAAAPPQPPAAAAMPTIINPPIVSQVVTIPSISFITNPLPSSQIQPQPPLPLPLPLPAPVTTTTTVQNPSQTASIPSSRPNVYENLSFSTSSSSTSSDEEPGRRRRKRKRKWETFFQRLMKEVLHKQEEMQNKFLETLERRERDHVAREEAWRAQERVRTNREHEILAHERSMATAKDAAVIAFLQKQIPNAPQMQMPMQIQVQQPLPPQPQPPPIQPPDNGGGDNTFVPMSSSRWPKAEVEALIKLRTNMDTKYQENGPKGPLWEEISAAMGRLGYVRNTKRCKEKWENINKYFKKVKESNKKRPEDSKTCPYFQQLDALYREKTKSSGTTNDGSSNLNDPMAPIMVQPEQQWPLSREEQNEGEDVQGDGDEDDGDEDEEDDAGGYEVVANKGSSGGTVE